MMSSVYKPGPDKSAAVKLLLMPLVALAIESQNARPKLKDKLALEIIERMGCDLKQQSRLISELKRIELIAHSICFERRIKDFLRKYPDGIVVNIGCGLDTIFERLNNTSILWYDLDLPEVIALRRQFMPETENRTFIASSLLEIEWFKALDMNKTILFITKGVYSYFEERTIKKFLIRISHFFPKSELLFDVTSPWGTRRFNKLLKRIGIEKKSALKWGLKNVEAVLSWSPRFRLLGKYTAFKHCGIRMSLKNRFLGWIIDTLDMHYIVHLRLTPDYKHMSKSRNKIIEFLSNLL